MSLAVNLSSQSIGVLKQRGLSAGEVKDFSALFAKTQTEMADASSAREVLAGLSADELKLLQNAARLAEPINIANLSEEGAANLLAQPDKTGMVDLNNDGIVEIGEGRMVTFPPVNAPEHVRDAWKQATEGMPTGDKLMMELHMHILTYGVQLDGHNGKPPLPPEQQWSEHGTQELLDYGRGALEFAVQHDGWTRWNLMKRDFFDRFEQALNQ